ERALSEVWTPEYRETLTRAFRNARAVLAVNEESAALLRPYNGCVRVVTAGMDPARFPWPPSEGDDTRNEKTVLFFAGLVTEPIKGFPSLLEACRMLWRTRQDFELRVTCDPGDLPADAFLRGIGWQSQEQLAACYRRADVTLVTPIAQEGLGRTAVEAGAAGRPVVASRIGGLNDVVEHGVTGLHVDPGNAADIAETLAVLLDRPELRRRMGAAGRRRFERRYPWPTIIERHYDPLLSGEALAQRKMDRDGTEPRLGCVLAIRNRPADVLKRTLETYDFQSVTPHDRLLLDYGSDDESAGDYQRLCDEYGWRYVAADPKPDRWFLSDAYNRAVAALDVSVEVVFKNDVDVLLGEGVLERAARLGREHLCLFSCVTTHAATRYPKTFTSSNDVAALLHGEPPPVPMPGEGLHAFPKAWFERIGGLDLSFEEWGFEDSDLRQRARWSIGVARDSESLLVHQWHPRTDTSDGVTANGARHERMKFVQRVVRNRGQLVPAPTSGDEDPLADMDVIVKTFLRPEALRRLLTSIREFYPTLSVTVADDGGIREAGDAASRACCRLIDGDPHTKLLELPFDTGPDEGRNALIRNTDAPFLLLLDDDYCFTQETRVETLLERLKTDQTLGGVGGSCVDVSDRGRVPRRFAGTLTRRGEELVHAVGEFHDSDLKTCDVTLQFAIFRRNVFDRVRWEGGPGAHHYDLFLQLLETDWKVAQEDSVVVHHYHDTPSLPGYRTRRDSTAAAQQWLLEKWGLERITMDGRVVCEKRKPTSKVRHGVQVRRLEIGPGQKPLPGFETLDVNGAATYTARWGHDRLTGIIPPGSYDEVYASHVLEHVLWNRTDAALRDVFEVLTPGGRFEVWVPDFEYIVRCYQERMCGDGWRRDNPAGDPMLWVNGRIFTYGPGPENLHHACFDYEHLSVCLSRAGFVAIERIEKRTRGTSHGAIDLGVTCLRPN
ncbi:MAG: glycosyltransferase, partial [Planctomycetaceae bacterium]